MDSTDKYFSTSTLRVSKGATTRAANVPYNDASRPVVNDDASAMSTDPPHPDTTMGSDSVTTEHSERRSCSEPQPSAARYTAQGQPIRNSRRTCTAPRRLTGKMKLTLKKAMKIGACCVIQPEEAEDATSSHRP